MSEGIDWNEAAERANSGNAPLESVREETEAEEDEPVAVKQESNTLP